MNIFIKVKGVKRNAKNNRIKKRKNVCVRER